MLIAKTLVHGWPLLVSTTHLESPVPGDMFKVGGSEGHDGEAFCIFLPYMVPGDMFEVCM